MPFVIVLLFDVKSSDIIYRVFKRFKKSKISNKDIINDLKIKPHITFSSYENIDLEIVKERLNQFCSNNNKFKI